MQKNDNNNIHALYSILTQLVVKGFEFSWDDVIRDDRFSFWDIFLKYRICQSESAKMCDTKFWKFKKKGEETYLTWFVVVEVTQKQTVTTRMIMQMVNTDVINSTSAKLNLTPFNLKNTLKNITLLSKAGSQKYCIKIC